VWWWVRTTTRCWACITIISVIIIIVIIIIIIIIVSVVMGKDYYKVLGVPRDASEEQVRKAYRRQALRFHPDKNRSAGAEERFREAAEAYDVLSDACKKEAYDRCREEGTSATTSTIIVIIIIIIIIVIIIIGIIIVVIGIIIIGIIIVVIIIFVIIIHLRLHLGHLADAFIQSDLQRVHLLKERQQYISVVPEDRNILGLEHS